MIEKVDLCANNPEKSLTTKVEQHIPYRCSMSTIWAFDNIENKVILYREEDCVKKVCTSLSEHASNVIVIVVEKDSQKGLLTIKIIKKLETIAIS